MTLDLMASEKALMTRDDREYEMDTATAATEQDEWSDYDSDDDSYVHSDAEDEDMLSDLEEEQDTEQDGEQDMRSSEGPPAKKGPVFDLLKRGVAPMDNPADPVNRDKIKSLYGECQTALNNIPGKSSNRVTEYYTSGSRLPARTVHMVQADYSKGKEKADNTFQRTAKDTKLVESIVSAIGGKEHRAAACSLLKAVGRRFKDEYGEVAKMLGVAGTIVPMTAQQAGSMKIDAGLTDAQLRMVKRKTEKHLSDINGGKWQQLRLGTCRRLDEHYYSGNIPCIKY